MEIWKVLVLLISSVLLAAGVLILVLSVVSPELLKRRGVRWFVTGKHPNPTPLDQRIMGGFSVAGALALGFNALGLVAYAALAVVPLWLLAILFRARLAKARA